MASAEFVACPRCAGGKEVTAERIAELMRLGHPVQDLKPGKCGYCGGVGHVPSVVAELVPLHDWNATPSRPPFASREEVLAVFDRLEQSPYSACRDDAWASAACLLLAADFDRGDLPAELWRRARPFLFGNSLGRMLAAEIAMELLSVGEAVEMAFSLDHPRAADVGPLTPHAPCFLMVNHALWMDNARGKVAAEDYAVRLEGIMDAIVRGDTLVALLKALASHCQEGGWAAAGAWSTQVAALPPTLGHRRTRQWPRAHAVVRICREVLPLLPDDLARSGYDTLVDSVVANPQNANSFAKTQLALLFYATTCLAPQDVDTLFNRLCDAIKLVPDRNEWAPCLGGLAADLSHAGVATESRLTVLVQAVTDVGLDDVWLGAGDGLSMAVVQRAEEPWAFAFYETLLHSAAGVRVRDNQAMGIGAIGGGLRHAAAAVAEPLFEATLRLSADLFSDGSERQWALEPTAQSLFAHWRQPYFLTLFRELIAKSLSATTRPEEALSWVNWLSDSAKRSDGNDYRDIFPLLFHETIEAIRLLPVEAQVTLADAVAMGLSGLVGHDAYAEQFVVLMQFIDSMPVGESVRTTALCNLLHTVCGNDSAFDAVAIAEIGRRLSACPSGPKKLEGVLSLAEQMDVVERHAARSLLDVPAVTLAAFSTLVAAGGLCRYSYGTTSGIDVVSRLTWLVEALAAPLPAIDRGAYENLFSELTGLVDSIAEYRDMNQQVAFRGSPRYSGQAALLRRIGPIGDDAWRLGFIQRVLDDLRTEGKPEHSRQFVHAILEALGSVEVGEWQKESLEKVLAFLAWERESDDSVLRRGIVAQLVRVGDLPQAARVAREVANSSLRSEALAEVARAMAASLPADALTLMQEVVSPELRAQVAVDLSATLPLDAERAWVLLETGAGAPARLQAIAVELLARDPGADVHGLLGILGWTPPAAANGDTVAAVLDELVEAECITGKKRDRMLGTMTSDQRVAVGNDAVAAVVAALVRLGLVAAEEAADFEPRRR